MSAAHRLAVCLLVVSLLAACSQAATPSTPTAAPEIAISSAKSDLSGIKTYLLEKTNTLKSNTGELKDFGDRYYQMAAAVNFDYDALWMNQGDEVRSLIDAARATWIEASPGYERIEGIVGGTPALAAYDVILDAGASGADDPENAAPLDLALPDGRVLSRPGNLFGVTESTLWGTFEAYRAPDVAPDFDGNGTIDFGETMPEANVFKASSEALDRYVGELLAAAQTWEPSDSDAFTALAVMVPTMTEYFNSWKSSRFVSGDDSTQRDFVAISRLADIQEILGSLQVVHAGVSPMIQRVDSAQDEQIGQNLADLKSFVANVYVQERAGKRFTPEEADLLGAEAQNRATAITGQLTQIAAQLGVAIQE